MFALEQVHLWFPHIQVNTATFLKIHYELNLLLNMCRVPRFDLKKKISVESALTSRGGHCF